MSLLHSCSQAEAVIVSFRCLIHHCDTPGEAEGVCLDMWEKKHRESVCVSVIKTTLPENTKGT